jgi:adenine-specific DNA methylase
MIEKNFDVPFIAGLALREKQIQQNFRPIIGVHKWFARRPGTLFRGLLLSEFGNGPLKEIFYQANRLSGLTVADPFMGGGTPIIEANRLDCDVVGVDINPMAYWIVKREIANLDIEEYRDAATRLLDYLHEQIDPC